MTSQSPRIYTYKITFEEVPYYYYGVHKEKKYDEYYMGSPKTHKWCWELYTPKKQILEIFDYTDEGWIEAQEVEKRIIKPILNDKSCLNENCGGIFSLEISRNIGNKIKNLGIGIFSLPPKKIKENGAKGGKISGKDNKKLKRGVFSLEKTELSDAGKLGSKVTNNQKWMCVETGFTTTSGPLTCYQRKRGIDTSKRIRIS